MEGIGSPLPLRGKGGWGALVPLVARRSKLRRFTSGYRPPPRWGGEGRGLCVWGWGACSLRGTRLGKAGHPGRRATWEGGAIEVGGPTSMARRRGVGGVSGDCGWDGSRRALIPWRDQWDVRCHAPRSLQGSQIVVRGSGHASIAHRDRSINRDKDVSLPFSSREEP